MLCLRGSFGIESAEQQGPDSLKWQKSTRVGPAETSKNCKCFCFSPSGDVLAWCNGEAVHLAHASSGFTKPSASLPSSAARTSFMAFSPMGSTLATWEVYAVKQGEGAKHNLNLWDAKTGKGLFGSGDSFCHLNLGFRIGLQQMHFIYVLASNVILRL